MVNPRTTSSVTETLEWCNGGKNEENGVFGGIAFGNNARPQYEQRRMKQIGNS